MPFGAAAPHRAGDDVAGREFGAGLVRHEALPGIVDQDRAVAAHRFGHQRHRPRRPVERGRMKLDEFEIGEFCACARRQRQPLAEAAGRVGAVQKQPADAACRDHDAAGVDHQRALRVHGEHALDGIVLDDQAARLDAFQQRDRRAAAHRCDQRAHDLAAGAVTGGVHDAVAAVRGFEAEPPAAVGPPVEGDAESGEMFDGRRRRLRRCGLRRPRRKGPRRRRAYRPDAGQGSSSSPIAAASPPCAHRLEASAPSGAFDSSSTGSGAICSAVINPAAPPPMMTGRLSKR